MPMININKSDLYFNDEGSGPETIVFAHGLLQSGWIFRNQVEAFRDRYRCITFDFRGHGRSQITQDGYDMESLTLDVTELIERLGCAPCHFFGHSMGSFVGMRLAIRRPDLVRSLILASTSADPQPRAEIVQYQLMAAFARVFGIRIFMGRLMRTLFGRKFLSNPARAVLRADCRKALMSINRVGASRSVRAVVHRGSFYRALDRIVQPTLVVAGGDDVAVPVSLVERVHARISGSKFLVIPYAGHTPMVEEPEVLNRALQEFLTGLSR